MDGIVCRDEAVAKVQNTVFSNTLQGAVYIKSQGLWTGKAYSPEYALA
jgi:hypothetical protein